MAYAEGYVAAVPLHILKTNRERANTSGRPLRVVDEETGVYRFFFINLIHIFRDNVECTYQLKNFFGGK